MKHRRKNLDSPISAADLIIRVTVERHEENVARGREQVAAAISEESALRATDRTYALYGGTTHVVEHLDDNGHWITLQNRQDTLGAYDDNHHPLGSVTA